ncbi:MAG: acetoin utilization protein AcuC [Proteobacteria bacterium]|nr:acetoin utilization protein AcuC [Pseudomonadota bacterium]
MSKRGSVATGAAGADHDGSRRRCLRAMAAAGLALGMTPRLASADAARVALFVSDTLASYGFAPPHPFSTTRQASFLAASLEQGLLAHCQPLSGRGADRDELTRFHTPAHVERVMHAEQNGLAALDEGDTPVFPRMHAIAASVVGAALDGMRRVVTGEFKRSLQPIGGLHHAARDHAAGFCVYNDVAVVIETLRKVHGIERVAYIDIDAHHGDGVYYGFETDAGVIIADVHQDGRTLFPGSGHADERGRDGALGSKLNIELPPRAGDRELMAVWPRIEAHLDAHAPQFFILQAGADSLAGDPLAQLEYTPTVHRHVATRLCALAARHADGRLMAFGGGGYAPANLAAAWTAVLSVLVNA